MRRLALLIATSLTCAVLPHPVAADTVSSQGNTAIADAASEAIGNSVSDLDSTFRKFLGAVTISSWSDLIDAQIAVKNNVGLVIKAASDSTSIYVHTINRSGGNYTPAATTDLKLRLGIVKD